MRQLLSLCCLALVVACDSTDSKPPITASQLSANIRSQLEAGNYAAAENVTTTLVKRFPDSPEATAASAQLPSFKARATKQRAEQEQQRAQQAQMDAKASAQAKALKDANFEQQHAAAVGLAKLQYSMRNPDSFRVEFVHQMVSGVVCYRYRAQNGFGGMNVESAALVNGRLHIGTEPWNAYCGGKYGTDITADVNEILQTAHRLYDQ